MAADAWRMSKSRVVQGSSPTTTVAVTWHRVAMSRCGVSKNMAASEGVDEGNGMGEDGQLGLLRPEVEGRVMALSAAAGIALLR